jgi:hypothetical protein
LLVGAALGAAVIASGAPNAHAADPAAEQAAKKRFAQGSLLFKQGNYEAARAAFLDAYGLAPMGFILRNVAASEMRLGKPLDALRHLRGALAAPDLSSDRRAVVQKDLDEAYSATGHVGLNVADGAAVSVDGTAVEGQAPFKDPIDVMPGHHVFDARLGPRTAHVEAEVKAGAVQNVTLDLPPPPPPPATVTASPVALPPPPAEQPSQVSEGFWTTRRDVGVVVTGVGLVALGVGLGFDVASQNHASNATGIQLSSTACTGVSQPAGCNTFRSEQDAQRSDATLSRVFLGVGIAGAVAGVVLFFWPSSPSRVALGPMATPYGGGLQLRGDL